MPSARWSFISSTLVVEIATLFSSNLNSKSFSTQAISIESSFCACGGSNFFAALISSSILASPSSRTSPSNYISPSMPALSFSFVLPRTASSSPFSYGCETAFQFGHIPDNMTMTFFHQIVYFSNILALKFGDESSHSEANDLQRQPCETLASMPLAKDNALLFANTRSGACGEWSETFLAMKVGLAKPSFWSPAVGILEIFRVTMKREDRSGHSACQIVSANGGRTRNLFYLPQLEYNSLQC